MAPLEMIEKYSADAVRYWAASTGLGKDSVISEEKIQDGRETGDETVERGEVRRAVSGRLNCPRRRQIRLLPTDRWLLSRTQRLIARVTALFEAYDYAAAKSEIEAFFWRDLADNYLELAKARLYDGVWSGARGGALDARRGPAGRRSSSSHRSCRT